MLALYSCSKESETIGLGSSAVYIVIKEVNFNDTLNQSIIIHNASHYSAPQNLGSYMIEQTSDTHTFYFPPNTYINQGNYYIINDTSLGNFTINTQSDTLYLKNVNAAPGSYSSLWYH